MAVTIHQGDCIAVMREMPAESVDIVITSPPYWGLRDYGVEGQLGLEPTLGEHLDAMVEVFREIHRILKPTGTVWLNYGDCYATSQNGRKAKDIKNDDRKFRDKPFSTVGAIYDPEFRARTVGKAGSFRNQDKSVAKKGRVVANGGYLKPKDLCMVPNRLAIALQEDGWWIRSEIIWAKPNPMPESVTDRPGTAHEKIFLLSKSARYYYDTYAVRVQTSGNTHSRGNKLSPPSESAGIGHAGWSKSMTEDNNRKDRKLRNYESDKDLPSGSASSKNYKGQYPKTKMRDKQRGHSRRHNGFNDRWDHMSAAEQRSNGRHLKNYEPAPVEVWEMPTRPFKEAHFATFPPELVERCLKAGCPPDGVVFDPFGGAGTTGLVADRMGFDCIMVELSEPYIEIAQRRIQNDNPMFGEVVVA